MIITDVSQFMDGLPVIDGQKPSLEEYYFMHWCYDLMREGYIDMIKYKEETVPLVDPVTMGWMEVKKTKNVWHPKTIFEKATYTPDFVIRFTDKAEDLLFAGFVTYYKANPYTQFQYFYQSAWVDVKGGYEAFGHSQKAVFELIRKLVMDKYNIYIHRIEVPKIFEKTFIPERYRLTDKQTKERTLKKSYDSLEQFIAKAQSWKTANAFKQV